MSPNDGCLGFLDGGPQVLGGFITGVSAIGQLEKPLDPSNLGMGLQGFEQGLHAIGAPHNEIELLSHGAAYRFSELLFDSLAIDRHHPNGFFQIVTDDMVELLELLVRAQKLRRSAQELFLRLSASLDFLFQPSLHLVLI